MKTDKNTHNLGSEFHQGSQNWFYLVVQDDGSWKVVKEKDYDDPNKDGYKETLAPADFHHYKVYDTPLADAVALKLSELGLNPN